AGCAGGLAFTVFPFTQRRRTQAKGAGKGLATQSDSLAGRFDIRRFHGNADDPRGGRLITPAVREGFLQPLHDSLKSLLAHIFVLRSCCLISATTLASAFRSAVVRLAFSFLPKMSSR